MAAPQASKFTGSGKSVTQPRAGPGPGGGPGLRGQWPGRQAAALALSGPGSEFRSDSNSESFMPVVIQVKYYPSRRIHCILKFKFNLPVTVIFESG